MPGPLTGGASTSTPGLPVWTYTAGAMAAGKLKTNHANPVSTTSIDLSVTSKNGAADSEGGIFGNMIAGTALLLFTNASGQTAVFTAGSITNNTTYYTFGVSIVAGAPGAWSGDYQLSFAPKTEFPVTTVNGEAGAVSIDVADVQAASSITPCADNTYAVPTSITTVKGIITAIS